VAIFSFDFFFFSSFPKLKPLHTIKSNDINETQKL